MFRKPSFLTALVLFAVCGTSNAGAQAQSRKWADLTGRFQITGKLIEVRDSKVYIRKADGKIFRIPESRLSQEDQDWLERLRNPITPIESNEKTDGGKIDAAIPLWDTPITLQLQHAETLTPLLNAPWKIPKREEIVQLECKASLLPAKTNFYEKTHAVVVNTRCARALIGHSVSFSVPESMSRVVMVDLIAGKSISSQSVRGTMRPLAMLDDGNTMLMVGTGKEENESELQMWYVDGESVNRSDSWIPFAGDKKGYGRVSDAEVTQAVCLADENVLIASDQGHVVVLNVRTRKPRWHGKLSARSHAVSVSPDKKLVAILDAKNLMIVSAESGKLHGSVPVSVKTITHPKVCWSRDGNRIALTTGSQLQILEVDSGTWVREISFPSSSIASSGLLLPDDDFALLNKRTLVHLPTRIELCDYSGIESVVNVADTTLVCVQSTEGGILMPTRFPHARAEAVLENAQGDKSFFVVKPGTEVAIDVDGVAEEYREQVQGWIEEAAVKSGYRVTTDSPAQIIASISGPRLERVDFIAQGSYEVDKYSSRITLLWNQQKLWSRSSSNVPSVVFMHRGKSMEETLDEMGKKPDLKLFQETRYPEFLQKPSLQRRPIAARNSNAALYSTFTRQGILDSN